MGLAPGPWNSMRMEVGCEVMVVLEGWMFGKGSLGPGVAVV